MVAQVARPPPLQNLPLQIDLLKTDTKFAMANSAHWAKWTKFVHFVQYDTKICRAKWTNFVQYANGHKICYGKFCVILTKSARGGFRANPFVQIVQIVQIHLSNLLSKLICLGKFCITWIYKFCPIWYKDLQGILDKMDKVDKICPICLANFGIKRKCNICVCPICKARVCCKRKCNKSVCPICKANGENGQSGQNLSNMLTWS